MPNDFDPRRIEDLMKSGGLDFRGACNEAVPDSYRPVRSRVISRLTESDTAAKVIYRIWKNLLVRSRRGELKDGPERELGDAVERISVFLRSSASPAGSEDAFGTAPDWENGFSPFWNAVAIDAAWKTLVLESVVKERKWADLLHPDVQGVAEKGKKIWDLLHPAAKALGTAIVVGAATYGGIKVAFDGPPLLKVVNPGPLDVRWTTPPPPETVTLAFPKDDPTLHINPKVPNLDISDRTLNLNDTGHLIEGLRGSIGVLATSSDSLNANFGRVGTGLSSLPASFGGIQGQLHAISLKLAADSAIVDGSPMNSTDAANAGAGQSKAGTIVEGLRAINQTTEGVNTQSRMLASGLQSGVFSARLTLGGSGVQTIVFPKVDETGKAVPVPLEVSVAKVSGSGPSGKVNLQVKNVYTQKALFGPQELNEGASVPLDDIDAKLVVNSVDRHLLFMHRVQVTIAPKLDEVTSAKK